MSHTYSVYRIFTSLSLLLLLIIYACNDKVEKNEVTLNDSLNRNSNNQTFSENDSDSYTSFINTLNAYSDKYKALIEWADYNNKEKSKVNYDLKNKYLILPVFKEQIAYLFQSDITDTILIFSGRKSNSFIINITDGKDLFRQLNDKNNGIMIIHIKEVDNSQKLYLSKKYTDFLHKENKVTEYYIKAELIETINLNVKEDLLKEKFKLE